MKSSFFLLVILFASCATRDQVSRSNANKQKDAENSPVKNGGVNESEAGSNNKSNWAMPVGGILNDKATFLPKPEYSHSTKVKGQVRVAVLVNESGKVYSAGAIYGPSVMRLRAERAARQAEVSPMIFDGKAVKFSGFLIYEFEE
ncbi:MAG: hypothetical protein HOP17_11785 [Acidobacteria bacterium]|nr:hypothetical protein [Acidobacteriota bacterium]